MRRVILDEWMTLDGVVQAPSYPDEDKDGGFEHGGWHTQYLDDISGKWIVKNIAEAEGFILGRRTYEVFAAHWPKAPDEERALAEPLNTRPKFVASTTLSGPLKWQNSTVLQGDISEAVLALKHDGDGGELHVIGSTQLARTLIQRALVDGLRLMIDPVVVGGGKRVFPDNGGLRRFRLIDSQTTTTGAILATYG